jgi:predicted regulator of Ras-like GTPase activity (Roadblock/LC7/MglB family)
MKESRNNIVTLIILAALLAVYDILREWVNYTTVMSLIIVLTLFSAWMVGHILITKFLLKEKGQDEPTARADEVNTTIKATVYEWSPPDKDLSAQKLRLVSGAQKAAATPAEAPVILPSPELLLPESSRARVQKIVNGLCTVSGITSAAVVSKNGMVVVSVPDGAISSNRAAAVTVSMFELGSRILKQLGNKRLEELIVTGDGGMVYFQNVGEEAFIMAIVEENTLLGGVVKEVHRTAKLAAAAMAA